MEADSDRPDQNERKILKTISGSTTATPVHYEGQLLFKKFKYFFLFENVIKIKN
jgi:hypothetical protein